MILPPPRSTRTCTRFPYTTRLRSPAKDRCDGRVGFGADQFGAGKQLLRGRRLLRRRRAFAFGVAGRGRTSARPLGRGGSRQLSGVAGRQGGGRAAWHLPRRRSEEHTSELQSLMRISYAVFC